MSLDASTSPPDRAVDVHEAAFTASAVDSVPKREFVSLRTRPLNQPTCPQRVTRRGVAILGTLGTKTLGPGSGGSPGPGLFARGSYGQQVLARVESAGLYRAEAVFIIPMGIALFLLGSRLLRAGAFAPDPHGAGIRRRLMLAGLGAGVPLNLLSSYAGPRWFMVDRYVCTPLVTFGLIGLVTTIVHALPAGPGSSAGR